MKISVLLDKEGQVYGYSPCHRQIDIITNEEIYSPSLVLDEESELLGCSAIIIDDAEIPKGTELWQCKYIDDKLQYCAEKVEFVELSQLRAERESEFKKYDKYQLPYVQAALTEKQILEYNQWRQAWLDITVTNIKPQTPEWFY